MKSKVLRRDVLIVGGGLAGERCAIEAASAGQSVIILSLVPPRRSHSCAAQGGMQELFDGPLAIRDLVVASFLHGVDKHTDRSHGASSGDCRAPHSIVGGSLPP